LDLVIYLSILAPHRVTRSCASRRSTGHSIDQSIDRQITRSSVHKIDRHITTSQDHQIRHLSDDMGGTGLEPVTAGV
jgi:hypothetical protein